MNSMKVLLVFVALFVVATAVNKCCPQPENEGMCGCCPDACCCICEDIVVTMPPPTRGTQPPLTTETCVLGPLDVALIADNSHSIGFSGWPLFMAFMGMLVASPAWNGVGGDDTRFGFIKFDDFAQVIWEITDPNFDTVAELQEGFENEPYEPGFTNTIAGMELGTTMLTDGDRDDAVYADIAILFADGLTNEPTGFLEMLDPVSEALRSDSDLLFAVAIGDKLGAIGLAELQLITGRTDNASIFFVEDFAGLEAALPDFLDAIVQRICDVVVLPSPPTTTQPPVTITVPNCECCCPPLPDPCDGGKIKGGEFCPSGGCGCCRFDNGDEEDMDGGGRRR